MEGNSSIIIARIAMTQYEKYINEAVRDAYIENYIATLREVFENELYEMAHDRVLDMKIPSNERNLIEAEIDRCLIELLSDHGATLRRSEIYQDESNSWDRYDDES
jgi:hypothetical protein